MHLSLTAMAMVASVGFLLAGCAAQQAQRATTEDRAKYAKCVADNRATPEGQMLSTRLWAWDGSDTAAKLTDPNPLTKAERDALVQVHNRTLQCRQIVISHDMQYAAWETPYWQELFQRSDAIFYKLAIGEIAVDTANKLSIESNGKFQVDITRGHADVVRDEEVRQQQVAEAFIQANARIAASQPRPQMTTTNCTWLGNTLNCTSMR
jgi:hypothetical protein